MTSPRLFRRHATLLVAIFLPLWVGCGTEKYETRMAKTIASLKVAGKFVDLTPAPAGIVDPNKGVLVNASMRLPKAFANLQPLNEQSADPNMKDDPSYKGVIPPDRIQPPFLNIPGFQMTYEQLVTSSVGQRIMSLYFGVVPANPEILDKMPAEIKSKLKLAEDLYWKDESVLKPDATSSAWKSITVQAPMTFYWTNRGLSTPEELDGTFGIWCHEEQGHYVFVAYRFPTSSKSSDPKANGLPEALRNAAGTLQVIAPGGTARTETP